MAMRSDVARLERQYLLDMLDTSGTRILEIGCGEGRMTWQYADTAHHIVAMDVEIEDVQQGHKSCPEALRDTVDFLVGSAIILPFAPASFDHVVFAWSF